MSANSGDVCNTLHRKSRSESLVESVDENSSSSSAEKEDGSSSSSSSSWSDQDESAGASSSRTPSHPRSGSTTLSATENNHSDRTVRTHLSFVEHQSTSPTSPAEANFEAHAQHAAFQHPPPDSTSHPSNSNPVVPPDQERQILLLMLLAQVCALHDPTPRTFTVHVLELFERGLLDQQSINFLYDLGLVPRKPATPLLLEGPQIPDASTSSGDNNNRRDEQLALIPAKNNPTSRVRFLQQQRSMEASAIRSTLAHHERQQRSRRSRSDPERGGPAAPAAAAASPATERALSWSVEEHPLSLSRFQREFDQIGLLASGSFGQVFRAASKMDGREYAVKRVPFAAAGYSRDSVQQVVREVRCLAVFDHPNIVRYYTSWLEPSWMTGTASGGGMMDGDGSTSTCNNNNNNNSNKQHLKLLTDIQRIITSGEGSDTLSDDLNEYFKDRSIGAKPVHRRRASFSDGCFDASASSWGEFDGDYSEWTADQSKDDLFLDRYRSRNQSLSIFERDDDDEDDIFDRGSSRKSEAQKPAPKPRDEEQRPHYRYQICLFIQMQLCHPATLADWIRTRNQKMSDSSLGDRLGSAAEIFAQIADGLSHVHDRNIIHRDRKLQKPW